MTSLSDFPPDVQAAASKAHAEYASSMCLDNLGVIIARAIITDRASRIAPRIGGLTAHQKRVLGFLQSYTAEHGISPSYEEIRVFLGIVSKSGVTRLIDQLEMRGRIARVPNRSRAITILPSPTPGA